jgi:hypothetical protein
VLSTLKPGKDPKLSFSKTPRSLLDTIGYLFEKMLLARVLRDVNEYGLLCDEQFVFRPRYDTTLQLARLVERVNRNFYEKRLTAAVFLNVTKALKPCGSKASFKAKLTKLPILPCQYHYSYLDCRTFQTSFQSATSTCRGMRSGVAQGGLVSPVLFSLYVNDITTTSLNVE